MMIFLKTLPFFPEGGNGLLWTARGKIQFIKQKKDLPVSVSSSGTSMVMLASALGEDFVFKML